MDGEEHDFGGGCDSANFVGGLDAVFLRHIYVEQNDFRFELFDLFYGLFAARRFADNIKLMPMEQFADSQPRKLMVIDNKDSGWQLNPSSYAGGLGSG